MPGFVTHDPGSGAVFGSGLAPVVEANGRLLQRACVRGLSCEVSMGVIAAILFKKRLNNVSFPCCAQVSDTALLFGDADAGVVLSHAFHVQNPQARGGCGHYSIVVGSPAPPDSPGSRDSGSRLLHAWPALAAHVAALAAEIQALVGPGHPSVSYACSPAVVVGGCAELAPCGRADVQVMRVFGG